jgi:RNA polymerase sigma factor (sigma-70 family)
MRGTRVRANGTPKRIAKAMANQKGPLGKNDIAGIVADYQPRLRSFIRSRVKRAEDAEDILQDVFYQLLNAVDKVMNPIENVSAWLYRVSRNAIINKESKKKEAELPFYLDDDGDDSVLGDFTEVLFQENVPTPEVEYLRSLVWEELERALSELPAEQREIFELTENEGIPVKEVSESTGIPMNTLLSRKHYAVLHLRKRLNGLYRDLISDS